jgi:hypothetical protein
MSRNIARFEQLAYIGLLLAVVEAPLEFLRASAEMQGTPAAVNASKIIAFAAELLGLLIGWLPIWLVARRNRLGARWLFVLVYLVALTFSIINYGTAGRLFDVLHILQAGFWTCALYFVFASEPRSELEPAPIVRSAVRIVTRWARPQAQPASVPASTQAPAPAPLRMPDVRSAVQRFTRWARPQAAAAPAQASRLAEPKTSTIKTRMPAGRREVVAPGEVDHEGKVNAHVAEMGSAGVADYIAAPPPFRLAWKMGLAIPPPLFLGFIPIFLMVGVPLTLVWALLSGLTGLLGWAISTFVALTVGLSIAAAVADFYRRKSRGLALPSWENYLPARHTISR